VKRPEHPPTQSIGHPEEPWFGIAILAVIVVAVLAVFTRGAEPHKPTLTIAVDSGQRSVMLIGELHRNWTQPNPALHLTRAQCAEVAKRGAELNKLASKINSYFRVVYVTQDCSELPLSLKFHLPAVRINRGAWESLDRRAFAFESRPLQMIEWYMQRDLLVANRGPDPHRPLDEIIHEKCLSIAQTDCGEGYSGVKEGQALVVSAPWEAPTAKPEKAHYEDKYSEELDYYKGEAKSRACATTFELWGL
jgi:hypothetical protein